MKARRTLLYALPSALYALLLTGCHHLPPPKPLEQLTPQEAQGHAVFEAHCAVCHYDRQEGPRNGPSLLGVTKKSYLPSGAPSTDERITATIQHGRGMMPAQPNLDDLEMQSLLAYLHTL